MSTPILIPEGPVPASRRNPQMALYYGPPKVGKALRNGTAVLTSNGWCAIESLVPGELVAGYRGGFWRVNGVFPQPIQPMFAVHFIDGTVVQCSADHLWMVEKVDGRGKFRVITTAEVARRLRCGSKYNWAIPYCRPVRWPIANLPLDPYLLGYLLADGSLHQNRVSFSEDKIQLLPRLRLLTQDTFVHYGRFDYYIRGPHVRGIIKRLGLAVRSPQKFIPPGYLTGAIEQRIGLLQGLMDGDGTALAKSGVEFCSSSPKLALDVMELIRGLGGRCEMSVGPAYYRNDCGARIQAKDRHRVTASFFKGVCPFTLESKLSRFRFKHRTLTKSIVAVEEVGADACTCIETNSPDGLFVTEGYNLTHNTHSVAALPDCLILELEPGGADHFPARKIDVPDMDALLRILVELTARRKAGNPAARRLAIDTVDVVEEWCDPEALREYKASTLGKNFEGTSIIELPQGAGYFRLREKFGEMLWLFTQAADQIILLGHVRDKFLGTTRGEVMIQDLDLSGKIRNIACSRSSAVGFMRRDYNNNLLLSFKTSDAVNCGSRCEHLRGREFVVGRLADGQPNFDWSAVYIEEPKLDGSHP